MNWDLFSLTGYASIALWLCMPLFWLLHFLSGRRGWLVHLALLLGVAAFVLAKVNSHAYISRIQVDRSEQIKQQRERQQLAQQAATEAREDEVAQIRFAEDNADDFLDAAGMDQSDLEYLQSFGGDSEPEWKQEKQQRSYKTVDDSLESQIGATETAEGIDSGAGIESDPPEPILMSGRDKLAANRFDAANLMVIRVMLCLAVVLVVVDYLGRANCYELAYFPLPLPSSWVDAMTPRDAVAFRSCSPRRSLLEELDIFTRRGESFVYVTEDAVSAAEAARTHARLPLGGWPVEVLNVANFDSKVNDEFVFETLWFGRNSFVVNSSERAEQLLAKFIDLMADRRTTRARAKQAVHVVWDVDAPVPEAVRQRFANLGQATGYTLLLCREEA
ncbi:MAG: hypothetical protein P8L85_00010 [Rubripirellula sp.]|nr:hypothetical protein [Rubripirellula sp.]